MMYFIQSRYNQISRVGLIFADSSHFLSIKNTNENQAQPSTSAGPSTSAPNKAGTWRPSQLEKPNDPEEKKDEEKVHNVQDRESETGQSDSETVYVEVNTLNATLQQQTETLKVLAETMKAIRADLKNQQERREHMTSSFLEFTRDQIKCQDATNRSYNDLMHMVKELAANVKTTLCEVKHINEVLPESEVSNANSTVISTKIRPHRAPETINQRNSESYDSLDITIAQLNKTLEQNLAPKRSFGEVKQREGRTTMQKRTRPHQMIAEMISRGRINDEQDTIKGQSMTNVRSIREITTRGNTTDQRIAEQKQRLSTIATGATTEKQDTGRAMSSRRQQAMVLLRVQRPDLGSRGAPASVPTEVSCNAENGVIGSWLHETRLVSRRTRYQNRSKNDNEKL
ncbi:unnamed protein product [Trichogramma brassicae]|uniref:Uncharacterized protein n=2 Tax=Trichogramma brassicae TaxID=86971 RepID=A0A6H5J1A7_9HYME|nr:unnamed protein product [Trichogramma brassicae]CAB0042078.1 unnamed protein product [Trichogramma brassicae]